MTSLQELKDKWFVDIADEEAFPPQARYPGSSIKPHTDGNLVEPLIDGAAIMGDFYQRLERMIQSDDPSQTIAMLAAMGIDPVKPLGEDAPGDDIKTKLLESKILVQQASSNTKEQFASSPDLDEAVSNAIMDALNAHTAMSKQALDSERGRLGLKEILLGPGQLWETLRAHRDSSEANDVSWPKG